jgi:tetratricopeptide (TPR) repeat protein
VQRPGQALPRHAPEPGQPPLTHFHKQLLKSGEGQRELHIALVYQAGPSFLPQALAFLERYLAKHPDDPEVLEALGVARMRHKDDQGALDCFDKILAVTPKFERVLSNAAFVAGNLGLDEKAAAYLKRAIQVNPYASRYYIAAGYQALKGENWGKAQQAVEKALELNPASLEARRLLVILHTRQGNHDQALEAWRAFAALDPPDKEEIRKLLD